MSRRKIRFASTNKVPAYSLYQDCYNVTTSNNGPIHLIIKVFNYLLWKWYWTYLEVDVVVYSRVSHNAASNSADLGIVLMIKHSWKFLHNIEPWISADKKTWTALESWINTDKITYTVLKPWINADKITCIVLKHWTLNSADLHNAASLVAEKGSIVRGPTVVHLKNFVQACNNI